MINFYRRFYLFLSFLFVYEIAHSQEIISFNKVNFYYSELLVNVNHGKLKLKPESGFRYTSFVLEASKPCDNINLFFTNELGKTDSLFTSIGISHDASADLIFATPLQVFSTEQHEVNINLGNYKGELKIKLFYAPLLPNIASSGLLHKFTNPCDKPDMISYTVWRAGLPNPLPPRLTTDVEHLVVHHSAGNNDDTNYVNIVRNIYLLHTQSNGWDDIGYNFLVAPNGVIFKGRDPQGVGDEDDILGAHFCGKNQNTMGVCMMGDFMKVMPTPAAVFSLNYLLAWKLKKDGIDAFGQTIHPRTAGNLLNNVCGHRDACPTDCPGDSLYSILSKIKGEAARIADSCGLVLLSTEPELYLNTVIFPNPTNGEFVVKTKSQSAELNIYDAKGQMVFSATCKPEQSFQLFLPSGLYFYRLFENSSNIKTGKLILIKH